MLNRNSKKFLRFLLSNSPDYADRVYTYDWIEENYNDKIQNVFATVRYLEKLGYLEIAISKPTDVHFGVILTELALHPYEFTAAEFKSFLFRSILTPVLVSMATTLLTLWITWLIQR